MERAVIHVDMDAFFASVEQRDNPELRGKPVVVGGASRRGVVAAASYEVRKFGVRSAMPMVEALRRCPQAIVVSPSRGRYTDASRSIFEIFERYTPSVEGLSIDEAFLDVTASQSLFGSPETIAEAIRRDIKSETDLTASAGVSPCKFVSKIASDFNKPNGLTVVHKSEVTSFLDPLPIERMWRIGKSTVAEVKGLGIDTFEGLRKADPRWLYPILGKWADQAIALAGGHDDRPVISDRKAKSIGAEETLEDDLLQKTDIEHELLALSERVAERLTLMDTHASTVTVKLKYSDFSLKTRQSKQNHGIDNTDTLYHAARMLLTKFPKSSLGVRLVGVAVSDLHRGAPSRTLFSDENAEKRRVLQQTVTGLRSKMGPRIITRARLNKDS